MPTGYTAAIKDGISFRKYAMYCARAFGACISLRDGGGGGESIPESFKPSDYHAKAIERTRNEIADVEAMDANACTRAAAAEWDKHEALRAKSLRERHDLRQKYEAMLAQVNDWEPPTNEHIKFKKFMREQIEESIKFDCSSIGSDDPWPILTGDAWRARTLTELRRSLAYHERENAAEIERTNQRNAWISALRESLKETA